MIDNPNPELKNIVEPVIKAELEKARIIGTQIGWQAAFIQAYEKVKDMQTVDEIKTCLRAEADAVRERMGLKSAFDEDGNLIVNEEKRMANPYKVKFYHDEDSYGIEVGHEIQNTTKEDGIEVDFRAYDLCECPEDATLNRSLFNGYEYISALELGMKLARLGYDSIEVEHIDGDKEDEN